MRIKTYLTALLLAVLTISISAQDSLSIGFSIGDFHLERWQKDKNYFIKSVNALGAKVFCEYAYGDAAKQVEQVEKLINLGLKVIVIIPTDAFAFKEVIEKGKKQGVVFISYDRMLMNTNIDYYVSFDNIKVGELQAQFAVNKKPKGKYILLAGPDSDNNALLFLEGQKKVLQPFIKRGDIEIVHEKHLSDWASMDAFLELQSFFESHNDTIDAIIASNDAIASGVLMAYDIMKEGVSVVLTGQDATVEAIKSIYSGRQTMTVYKPIMKLAQTVAELSLAILQDKNIDTPISINNNLKDVPSILLESVAVTEKNIDSTVIADGYYTESEIFESF